MLVPELAALGAAIDLVPNLGAVASRKRHHCPDASRDAIREIYPCGGRYRNATKDVFIQNSKHRLPDVAFVPSLVRDAVNWINRETSRSALERASYALWRFNWIHPFAGGNGRTSRALAYLIVCMQEGRMLPGVPSMPSLIYEHRDETFTCCELSTSCRRSPTPKALRRASSNRTSARWSISCGTC